MYYVCVPLLAAIVLFCNSHGHPAACEDHQPAESLPQVKQLLQDARDPRELEKAALRLCGNSEAHLQLLTTLLLDPAFLRRIDNDNEYQNYLEYHSSPLRVNRLIVAIGKVGTPEALKCLLRLVEDKVFTSHEARLDALIEASGFLRQSSTRMLAFLASDVVWKSDSYLAVRALARLGTPQALAVIEKRFFAARHSNYDRMGWFAAVLVHFRNEREVVALYKRILTRGVSDLALRNAIVQSLFEYRIKVWEYAPERYYGELWGHPRPRDASSEVLRELLTIADVVVKQPLAEDTQRGVPAARAEIAKILQRRKLTPTPQRLAQLLTDLDHSRFTVREKATTELEKLGDIVEDALRQTLARKPSAEVRRRVEMLLKKLENP